jgi:hypothetical protein
MSTIGSINGGGLQAVMHPQAASAPQQAARAQAGKPAENSPADAAEDAAAASSTAAGKGQNLDRIA